MRHKRGHPAYKGWSLVRAEARGRQDQKEAKEPNEQTVVKVPKDHCPVADRKFLM